MDGTIPPEEHEGKTGPDQEPETPTPDSCHQSQEVGDRTLSTIAPGPEYILSRNTIGELW